MVYEGKLDAKDLRFAIIVSRFNSFITERLLEGALDALKRHGAEERQIDIYKVPGAFEIPLMAKHLAGMREAGRHNLSRGGNKRRDAPFPLHRI